MAEGYHDFTSGEVLTAANLEDYCQNQSIMRFASAAARDTALSTVKTEGMYAFLEDVNTMTVYSGAAWSTIGPVHGSVSTWTPTLTQSGTVTATVTSARYTRVGRWIMGYTRLDVTGTGTATNAVTVSLPVAAASTVMGSGWIYDSSATTNYTGAASVNTSTTVAMIQHNSTSGFMGAVGNFTAALASGDIVQVSFMYEAAADA